MHTPFLVLTTSTLPCDYIHGLASFTYTYLDSYLVIVLQFSPVDSFVQRLLLFQEYQIFLALI